MTVVMLVQRFTMTRYLLASAAALGIDMTVFMATTAMGWPPMLSAFAGYATGMVLHWSISIRYVFRTHEDSPQSLTNAVTHGQRFAFFASALLGLGVTMAVVGGMTTLGTPASAAKAVAIGISFLTVYAIRKYGIFGLR